MTSSPRRSSPSRSARWERGRGRGRLRGGPDGEGAPGGWRRRGGRSATRRSSSSGSVREPMSDASEDAGASSARASPEEDARAIPERVPRARPKRAAVEPRDGAVGRGPTARRRKRARSARRREATRDGTPRDGAFTATGADIVSSRARACGERGAARGAGASSQYSLERTMDIDVASTWPSRRGEGKGR